jgi:hypothetical protein
MVKYDGFAIEKWWFSHEKWWFINREYDGCTMGKRKFAYLVQG